MARDAGSLCELRAAPDDSQQGKKDLSPIATGNRILPTVAVNLEVEFSPGPPDKNSG